MSVDGCSQPQELKSPRAGVSCTYELSNSRVGNKT